MLIEYIHAFTDPKFLAFFFRRIKNNSTGRYEEDFPYVSPCGPETNYIRCDDLPIVFTHLLDQTGGPIQDIESYGSFAGGEIRKKSHSSSPNDQVLQESSLKDSRTTHESSTSQHSETSCSELLSYGGARGSLTVPFQPDKLCMLPEGGRVYHAGPEKLEGVGLVKSSLAIELSRFFVYEDGATESSSPVGFRWRGTTWTIDGSTVRKLRQLRMINK